jgi:hypothetical protein
MAERKLLAREAEAEELRWRLRAMDRAEEEEELRSKERATMARAHETALEDARQEYALALEEAAADNDGLREESEGLREEAPARLPTVPAEHTHEYHLSRHLTYILN